MIGHRGFAPSLATLRTFEAVARLRSMSRAAVELGVTQGAVSRAIQTLEGELGAILFRRTRPYLHLTQASELLYGDVRDGFKSMHAGVRRVRNLTDTGRLAIDVLPTFAIRFLIPRLPGLTQQFPDIEVDLTVSERAIDFGVDNVDIAIRYGLEDQWPGAQTAHLMQEELILVCAPRRLGPGRQFETGLLHPRTLLRHTTRPNAWAEFLALANLPPVEPAGLGLEHFFMVIEAAVLDMGFALLPRFMIRRELSEGSLMAVPMPALLRPQGYFMLYQEGRPFEGRIALIADWLRAEVVRDESG